MLCQKYKAHRPCCGTLKTKYQQMEVQIDSSSFNYQRNSLSQLGGNPQQQNPVYKKGKFYATLNHIMCTYVKCPCPILGREFQIEGQIVSQTTLPRFCFCLGPFSVKHKDVPIGQLKPNWYICHFCLFNICHPCCTKLQVYNNINQIYTIQRIPFTCFCCTEWNVLDLSQQIKGNIKTGGCCFSYYDITLPMDREQHKQLILGSFGVLP